MTSPLLNFNIGFLAHFSFLPSRIYTFYLVILDMSVTKNEWKKPQLEDSKFSFCANYVLQVFPLSFNFQKEIFARSKLQNGPQVCIRKTHNGRVSQSIQRV
uniref:Uncharacterized protein n=1 Tax=Cacopsylla melanoneura TaxID=428564 RepID=A0A8D8STI4_9HEMI